MTEVPLMSETSTLTEAYFKLEIPSLEDGPVLQRPFKLYTPSLRGKPIKLYMPWLRPKPFRLYVPSLEDEPKKGKGKWKGKRKQEPPKRKRTTESELEFITLKFANILHETEEKPLKQIRKLIRFFGPKRLHEIIDEARHVEANGGMPRKDGEGQRTLGGVFFVLARQYMPSNIRWKIFPRISNKAWAAMMAERYGHQPKLARNRTAQNKGNQSRPTRPKQVKDITWGERGTLYVDIQKAEYGEARSVKVSLMGRPGKVITRGNLVMTVLQNSAPPPLPKGLPVPPTEPTSYAVYISAKQWRKIEASIADPEDVLFVEGWQAYDPELEGIAIWATKISTKLSARASRAGKAEAAVEAEVGV